MSKLELIKSPFNYIGGKFKLLPQILPLFPNDINTFYDVFGGGGNVILNVNANKYHYNEIVYQVTDMFKSLSYTCANETVQKVSNIIDEYKLSKTNEDGFLRLREDYNNGNDDWSMFYALVSHSFNYQFRFNNNHQYNSSFGRNRSYFTENMMNRLVSFVNKLYISDMMFTSKDFRELKIEDMHLQSNDLVYCDPPYLISTGNYNDGKRGFTGWGLDEEQSLLDILDCIDKKGSKFALSNVLRHKGRQNDMLIEWSKKYNINYLNADYSNCSYQGKNNGETIEVLITNY